MKKYLIKEITTSTATNKEFKNITKVFYVGRKEANTTSEDFLKFHAKHYGFSTKAAATKALKHYSEHVNWFNDTFKTWTSIFEIIEVEV